MDKLLCQWAENKTKCSMFHLLFLLLYVWMTSCPLVDKILYVYLSKRCSTAKIWITISWQIENGIPSYTSNIFQIMKTSYILRDEKGNSATIIHLGQWSVQVTLNISQFTTFWVNYFDLLNLHKGKESLWLNFRNCIKLFSLIYDIVKEISRLNKEVFMTMDVSSQNRK